MQKLQVVDENSKKNDFMQLLWCMQ